MYRYTHTRIYTYTDIYTYYIFHVYIYTSKDILYLQGLYFTLFVMSWYIYFQGFSAPLLTTGLNRVKVCFPFQAWLWGNLQDGQDKLKIEKSREIDKGKRGKEEPVKLCPWCEKPDPACGAFWFHEKYMKYS